MYSLVAQLVEHLKLNQEVPGLFPSWGIMIFSLHRHQTVRAIYCPSDNFHIFKKLVAKQWEMMGDADIDIILHTIKDPAAVYLHQHLTRGGVEVVDPPEDILTGPEFIHQLSERTRHAEETAFISDIFHHVAQAHKNLLEVCVNVSALAKVTDKTTLLAIINRAV